MARTIVSGAQTGVDRGALRAAVQLGIPTWGWVPKGRRAEDGRIPDFYHNLRECDSTDYRVRTTMNVRAGDLTLILIYGHRIGRGTRFTINECERLGKPYHVEDISQHDHLAFERVRHLVAAYEIVNVAGSRESSCPGIEEAAYKYMKDVLA